MPRDLGEIVKLGAAASFAIVALGYIYTQFFGGDSKSSSQKPKSGSGAAAEKATKKVEEANDADVQIYFGSQSGTAQGFSEELAEEAKQYGLTAQVVDMEDFDEDTFKTHKCVILVLATYGEGDPTDNAIEYFKWVQDADLGGDTLEDMSFTVMALGNRQYVNFNMCGRQADENMERLGAKRIYDKGEGDDDQNIEEDFEQWKEGGLWPAIQTALGKEADTEKHEAAGLENAEEVIAKLQLKAVVGDAQSAPTDPLVQVGGADIFGKWYFNASLAPITSCTELLQQPDPDKGKTTKHLDFSIKSFPAFEWRTADNLEVLAGNPDADVAWFADRLGVTEDLDKNIAFVRAEGVEKAVKRPFPAPCTVREALTLFCDLAGAPHKMPARRLAALATDEEDRTAFEQVVQDRETWQWLLGDGEKPARLTLREFFELFLASADVDFSTFVQLCPRNRSRPYTIASSSQADPKTIGVCVSIVQEDCPILADVLTELSSRGHPIPRAAELLERSGQSTRCFRGLCSTALCTQAEKGDKLWISARSSSFRLPRRTATPIIMIGAGTGMAPFRGFIQEFKAEGGKRTKTMFFFGCRRSDEDFLYKEELNEAVEGKYLSELITAFSREQAHKVYVQDRLKERSEEIGKLLLDEGAYLYICGSHHMGKSVNEVLANALGSKDQLDRLQKDGHIVEELW